MKAKKSLFLIVSFVIIGAVLQALINLVGVQITGPNWAQAVFFVITGFAGVVLWEFWESVK